MHFGIVHDVFSVNTASHSYLGDSRKRYRNVRRVLLFKFKDILINSFVGKHYHFTELLSVNSSETAFYKRRRFCTVFQFFRQVAGSEHTQLKRAGGDEIMPCRKDIALGEVRRFFS